MSPFRDRYRSCCPWLLVAVVGLSGLWVGCRQKPPPLPAAGPPKAAKRSTTAPAQPASQPGSQPATIPAATSPTSTPASRPALPASTYNPRPPYPVQLYVRKPTDKQPGWLRIVELSDGDVMAACHGVFPRRNRIEIETTNVQQLHLDIGFLPLAPGKRTILSIDGQTMELVHKNRRSVELERSGTGAWRVAEAN